jgi:SNF2 family DNA or RNA helicase
MNKLHDSTFEVSLTFGKYAGRSLAEIHNVDRTYLEWLVITPSIPQIWRDAAEHTLKGESVASLFPTGLTFIPSVKKGIIEYVDKETLRLHFEYNKALLERFKFAIDGRKWDNDLKCWEFPSVHIGKVINLFGGIQNIQADDKILKILKKETERRADLDEIRVKEDSDIEIPTKLPLFPFQKVGVDFVQRAGGRAMVADSMGLGKTITAIGYAEKNRLKTFIVCPKSTVPGWIREIKRFTGRNTALWTTDGREGRSDCQYHISNYDIIKNNLK